MTRFAKFRARARGAAKWLGPSVIAACGGALVAGGLEGLAMRTVFGAAAACGFLSIMALPLLVVTSALGRAVWSAWRPDELATQLIDDGGGAPRLAGWVLALGISLAGLGWAMFQGTWMLASWASFKPLSMAFAEPFLTITLVVLLVALSRPLARGLTAIVAAIDRRWRRNHTSSLLTPFKIAIGSATLAGAIAFSLWHWFIRVRIGPLDLGVLVAPVAGVIATAAVHLVWHRFSRWRRSITAVLGGCAAAAIALAVLALETRPGLTLEIWGDRPIAGLAIDTLFDLDAIRADMSLEGFRPTAHPGAPHPDIVLVTIDTVRADHTPPYHGSADMPVLGELAQRGVVFDWAFSPSNVTRRSIPSMTIGLQPNRVHGRVVGWALRVDPRHIMVAERLAAGGYETAGFMCCEGFWGTKFHTGMQRGLEHLELETNGRELARRGKEWIEARDKSGDHKPLFVWMHLLEPHNWTQSTGEPHNDEERRRYYDRALAESDVALGELLGAFAQREPGQAPIIIVTADHGEALGDHGQPFHSTDLYDSQIHVPLVVAGPGINAGRIPETVSLTDLTPTLLELAGFDPPRGRDIDGGSFAPLATGKRAPIPEGGIAFAAMIKDRSNPGGIEALVRGRWKLIENSSSYELYDIHSDPDERANVIASRPQLANELKALLRKRIDAGDVSPFD